MNSQAFGRRLRERRKAEDKTQDQVAAAAGCSRGMISQWEAGTPDRVDAGTALAVARYLHTTLDYLLDGDTAVQDDSAAYTCCSKSFDDDLAWLTPEERQQVEDEVRRMADHNRSVFKHLSLKRGADRGTSPVKEE